MLDVYQKEVVNIGIKYCKDVIKARKIHNKKPVAPLVMVHGGAGAGKSTVINILAVMAQKILLQPGDNPDHPYVVKTAFTGTAASLIKGQTLSKMFSFAFNSEATAVSDKTRDHVTCRT